MPPYKTQTTTTLTINTFIFNFCIISLILIENKCLSDVIWDLKKGEKKVSKRRTRTRVDRVTKHVPYTIYATETDAELASFLALSNPITHWWAELV